MKEKLLYSNEQMEKEQIRIKKNIATGIIIIIIIINVRFFSKCCCCCLECEKATAKNENEKKIKKNEEKRSNSRLAENKKRFNS